MAKGTAQAPKKGSKTKSTEDKNSDQDTAGSRAADFLESIDKEIASLQAKKDVALKSKVSVATSKGRRQVKSIYATKAPITQDGSTDSGKADNGHNSTDDG